MVLAVPAAAAAAAAVTAAAAADAAVPEEWFLRCGLDGVIIRIQYLRTVCGFQTPFYFSKVRKPCVNGESIEK